MSTVQVIPVRWTFALGGERYRVAMFAAETGDVHEAFTLTRLRDGAVFADGRFLEYGGLQPEVFPTIDAAVEAARKAK